MTLFIACAAVLFVLAALLLTRAFWRRRPAGRSAALAREVEQLGEDLRQLDTLHRAGGLTDEQAAGRKAQLERTLLDGLAIAATDPGVPDHAAASRSLGAVLVAFMLVVVIAGYRLLGSPDALAIGPGSVSAVADAGTGAQATSGNAPHAVSGEQIEAMIERLSDRLKSHPDDAEGWAMLARSDVALGRHAQAVDAFVHAERLRPDDPGLLADHADALAMTRQRNLEGEPSALIARALELDPANSKALALAGTAAFDRKDFKEAVRLWETLAKSEPPDGPFASQVHGAIEEARKLAGMPAAQAGPGGAETGAPPGVPTAAAAGTASPPTIGGTVAGTVVLSPALQARVSPDDTVFVFARAADGPPMPLAVLRKRVRDLPLQFTLDDRQAMTPTATLSSAQRVIVGARISRSGNALPQGGDLQGRGAAVAVGATGLRVEIDEEVAK